MKSIMLMVLVALALPALADKIPEGETHIATPDEEAYFALHDLAAANDHHVLVHMQIAIKDMQKFRAFSAKTDKEYDDYVRERLTYLCLHGSEFENDREALAQFYDDMDAQEAAMMQKTLRNLREAFEPSEVTSFFAYVQRERAGATIVGTFNRAARLRAGEGETPNEYIGRACIIITGNKP